MTPRETTDCWVERFNGADAVGLAELFHPNAVNDQVMQEPVEGREAIRAMFELPWVCAVVASSPCATDASLRNRVRARFPDYQLARFRRGHGKLSAASLARR
jgi:hypothetical protein